MKFSPTPKAEWVQAGDRCVSPAGMLGTVVRVVPIRPLPIVTVHWSNGHVGRMSITHLRRTTVTKQDEAKAWACLTQYWDNKAKVRS